MPIGKDDFEKGRAMSDSERLVLAFLEENRDKAFTADEIANALGFVRGQNFLSDLASSFSLNTLIENLVREGRIVKRLVNTAGLLQTYYAFKQDALGWSS